MDDTPCMVRPFRPARCLERSSGETRKALRKSLGARVPCIESTPGGSYGATRRDRLPEGGRRMATYALIHGAGDVGWYWHLVEAELRERGHDVVAPDLPCDDDSAGLPEYADTALDAIGDRKGLAVVGQSFGCFTATLVCDRVPTDL